MEVETSVVIGCTEQEADSDETHNCHKFAPFVAQSLQLLHLLYLLEKFLPLKEYSSEHYCHQQQCQKKKAKRCDEKVCEVGALPHL